MFEANLKSMVGGQNKEQIGGNLTKNSTTFSTRCCHGNNKMIYVAFSKMCPTETARTHSQIIHFFRTTWGPGKKTIKERDPEKKGDM